MRRSSRAGWSVHRAGNVTGGSVGSCLASPSAAVRAEKANRLIDHSNLRAVDAGPAGTLAADQPCALELLQMARELGGGNTERFGQGPGREPFRAGFHQPAEDIQPRLLRQHGKGSDRVLLLHNSKNVEL